MTTRSETLIQNVHPGLSADPAAVGVITLAPTASAVIAIDDQALRHTDLAGTETTYLLHSYTVTSLIAALPGALGAALVADSGWGNVSAEALIPVESDLLRVGTVTTLSAYTSVLWRVMRPIAAAIATTEDALDALLLQSNLRRATGSWLDDWGLVWGIGRAADEDDTTYRARMVASITRPRVSRPDLQSRLQETFGVVAAVVDGSAGTMTITIRQPSLVTSEATAALTAFINANKPAGVTYTLTVTYAPLATLGFSAIGATAGE